MMFSFRIFPFAIGLALTCLLMASACSNPDSANSASGAGEDGQIQFDSIKKLMIDTLAIQINKVIRTTDIPLRKIAYPQYNPTDSLGFWITDDHNGRFSMQMHPGNNIVWPYFWVHDGELVLYRMRSQTKLPTETTASETMIYIHKGKIVYCEERTKKLTTGEVPGAVQLEPYVRTTRPYAELDSEYKMYWTAFKKEMKKNKVLPSWLKD